MATKLYLRDSKDNAIGVFRDMITTAGAGVAPLGIVDTVASGTEIQWTDNAKTEVLEWISGRSPSGGWTLSGTVNFSIWARESNMNANCGARARLFKRTAGGSLTEISGGPYNDGVEFGTGPGEMTWSGTPTSTAFAENDRLVVRFYITNIGTMAGGHTCSIDYGAPDASQGDSFIEITENVTFKGEETIVPIPAASKTLTGLAAIVALSVAIPAASLALTGFAPTVTTGSNVSIAVPAGSLSLTGQVPTVTASNNVSVAVPAGALSLTGQTPTVTAGNNITVAVPAGTLTLTGFAPDPTIAVLVPIPTGALALNGQAPSVVNPVNVPVGAGSLTLTGFAPTPLSAVVVIVPAGTLTLNGQTPTAVNPVNVPVGPGSLTLTGQTPTVTVGNNVDVPVPAGSLSLNGFAPDVTTSVVVSVPAGALALTGQVPTVVNPLTILVPTGTISFSPQAPAPGLSVPIGGGAIALNGQAPALQLNLPVGAGSIALTGLAPTVQVSGSQQTIAVPVGSIVFTGYPVRFFTPGPGLSSSALAAPSATISTAAGDAALSTEG